MKKFTFPMVQTNFPFCLQHFLCVLFISICRCTPRGVTEPQQSVISPDEAIQYFAQQDKVVLTFVGYSGAEYEAADKMLDEARNILSQYSPQKTIVNIGATPSGIGAVYDVAKKMGFATTGIVSTQAKEYQVSLSPYVDRVFYIEDNTWGGFLKNTDKLSPTSQAMVQSSDIVIGIGGGEVARDEMLNAQRMGKKVRYIPADMNHQIAIEKARKKNIPVPIDFKGAAYENFGKPVAANSK